MYTRLFGGMTTILTFNTLLIFAYFIEQKCDILIASLSLTSIDMLINSFMYIVVFQKVKTHFSYYAMCKKYLFGNKCNLHLRHMFLL